MDIDEKMIIAKAFTTDMFNVLNAVNSIMSDFMKDDGVGLIDKLFVEQFTAINVSAGNCNLIDDAMSMASSALSAANKATSAASQALSEAVNASNIAANASADAANANAAAMMAEENAVAQANAAAEAMDAMVMAAENAAAGIEE
jgi:hypothetical protein